MATQFSKGEAIRFSWNTVKNNLGFFIKVGIIYSLSSILLNITRLVTNFNVLLAFFYLFHCFSFEYADLLRSNQDIFKILR